MRQVGFERGNDFVLLEMPAVSERFTPAQLASDLQKTKAVRRFLNEEVAKKLPSVEVFSRLVKNEQYEELYQSFCTAAFVCDERTVYQITVRPERSLFRPRQMSYGEICDAAIRFGGRITKGPILLLSEERVETLPVEFKRRMAELKKLRSLLIKTMGKAAGLTSFDFVARNPFGERTEVLIEHARAESVNETRDVRRMPSLKR